jgi:chromate transporter
VSVFVLYLILLKATLTSFSGLSSLPIIRDELVSHRHVLTDRQLDTAVAVGRSTPGPLGVYVVSVGYFVAGIPGALAGWLAMVTPALFVIPLLHFVGRRADHPRVRGTLSAVLIASVGLLLYAVLPMARDTVRGIVPLALAGASGAALIFVRIHTLWVVIGAAAVMLLASALQLVQ